MDWNWEVCLEDSEGKEVVVGLGELEDALLGSLPKDVLEGFIKDIKKVLSSC